MANISRIPINFFRKSYDIEEEYVKEERKSCLLSSPIAV